MSFRDRSRAKSAMRRLLSARVCSILRRNCTSSFSSGATAPPPGPEAPPAAARPANCAALESLSGASKSKTVPPAPASEPAATPFFLEAIASVNHRTFSATSSGPPNSSYSILWASPICPPARSLRSITCKSSTASSRYGSKASALCRDVRFFVQGVTSSMKSAQAVLASRLCAAPAVSVATTASSPVRVMRGKTCTNFKFRCVSCCPLKVPPLSQPPDALLSCAKPASCSAVASVRPRVSEYFCRTSLPPPTINEMRTIFPSLLGTGAAKASRTKSLTRASL
mmetsp:Transcript_72974/g.237244  ORF Transcript_72974/g.237244 Transcript_72974/m.237244 type:complete len:283 (+) Transcript_72974:2848-3696(+)